MRVLLADDHPLALAAVRVLLEGAADLEVVGEARSGSQVLPRARQAKPDLVLLDLNLPNGDGFELCRELRERSLVGIIVVSARRGEHDKVRALNLGADDYLTKPFGVEELLARIGATLRRTRVALAAVTEVPPPVRVGDVEIDLTARSVTRHGQLVHLTPTEFSLLAELARQPGTLLTHAHLLRRVWGPGYEMETEYVRVYVKRLRAKLEGDGAPPVIITEPRVGYRLAPGVSPTSGGAP